MRLKAGGCVHTVVRLMISQTCGWTVERVPPEPKVPPKSNHHDVAAFATPLQHSDLRFVYGERLSSMLP